MKHVYPTLPLRRRQLLKRAFVASVPAWALAAQAAYPERPIRLIVPSAAGGSPDVVCRIVAVELSKLLGQQVVVENKPGASGNIGMQEVVRAAPDGYTLGYGNVGTLSINASLFSKLPYDRDTQLAPVAMLGFVHNALVVRNELPVSDVKGLIALARSTPGRLVMASAGNGTTGHLGGELFKSMSNTFIVHVPYRGSPQAIQDLIGGQVDLMFDNLTSILPQIRQGRVKVLAVSGAKRSAALTQVPTVAEAGVPGYETEAWGGIVAPAATPREWVQHLHANVQRALTLPAVADRLAQLAFEPVLAPAERLFERARREQPLWAEVIRRSGAKLE
jgi:tripartite-type tricarboxylate transporter receptor subunit TctC